VSKGPPRQQKKERTKKDVKKMADFQDGTTTKTAFRNLTEPIADPTTFNAIVQAVIVSNPFGCVSYMSAGDTHPPVEKTKEAYTAKIVYQDTDAKKVGSGSESYNTIAGFNAGVTAMLANTANNTAHAGTPVHDLGSDTFSATLKCHDPNGEMYFVNISRGQVVISSYEDDSIRTRIETWADGVTALA